MHIKHNQETLPPSSPQRTLQ